MLRPIFMFKYALDEYYKVTGDNLDKSGNQIYLPASLYQELCQDFSDFMMRDNSLTMVSEVDATGFHTFCRIDQFKVSTEVLVAADGGVHSGPLIFYKSVPVTVAPVTEMTLYIEHRSATWTNESRTYTHLIG